MKFIALLWILFCFSCAGSKVVFNEKFSNNKNKWLTKENKDFKVTLDSGAYYMSKKVKNFDSRDCLWLAKEIKNFNSARDFTISFDLKILNQDDVENYFDFMWKILTQKMIDKKINYFIS